MQVLVGPILHFSAFCQWDEKKPVNVSFFKSAVCCTTINRGWKEEGRKEGRGEGRGEGRKKERKRKTDFYFIFCTKTNTVPLYFPHKKKNLHFCDTPTYFCTVPLFKLLFKELFHLGKFAQVKYVILL